MNARVRVFVYLKVPARQATEVEAIYHTISTQLHGTPGLIRNELLRNVHTPDAWAIMSEWSDISAFRTWESGTRHQNVTSPLRPYHNASLSSVFAVYEVTAEYGQEVDTDFSSK